MPALGAAKSHARPHNSPPETPCLSRQRTLPPHDSVVGVRYARSIFKKLLLVTDDRLFIYHMRECIIAVLHRGQRGVYPRM